MPKLNNKLYPDVDKSNEKKKYTWLNEKSRLKWKEEWKKKTEEASKFSKRMSEHQRIIRKYNTEQYKLMIEKLEREETERRELDLEEKRETETKRKEEHLKKLEEYLMKAVVKRIVWRKERKALLSFARNVPAQKLYLYERMTDQFANEVEATELERKKIIADRRKIYKSIRLNELKSFNQTLNNSLQKHKEDLEYSFAKKRNDAQKYMNLVKERYKTLTMEQIIKNEKDEKEQQQALSLQQKYI